MMKRKGKKKKKTGHRRKIVDDVMKALNSMDPNNSKNNVYNLFFQDTNKNMK